MLLNMKFLQVWDSTTLQCLRTLEGHEDNVRVLAYGGRYLFSGSWDKTIRVWDVETLECMRILEGHGEAVLALAVGETFLVSGSYDTTVRFWALDSLRCIRQIFPSSAAIDNCKPCHLPYKQWQRPSQIDDLCILSLKRCF